MKTMSPRVENGRIHLATRFGTARSGKSLVRAISIIVRRFIPERWLIDLLALALVGVLIGATSLYGLAVVSTWVPPQVPPIATPLMPGDHEGEPGAIAGCRDLVSRQEMP